MMMYLQLDGLKGESTDSDHRDWIELLSFNHAITQPASSISGTGGATAGRCQHSDFSITKHVDMTSPKLYEMCSSGKHIRRATLQMMRPSPEGARAQLMEIAFEDVTISHVAPASNGDIPAETVSLKYRAIKWTYTLPKRSDGSGGGNTTGSWSVVENKIAA